MYENLLQIEECVFTPQNLTITHYKPDKESIEYEACQFLLNNEKVICRTAKITPKKEGLFVTFWKRGVNGQTQPHSVQDAFDRLMIICRTQADLGYFFFSKSVLYTRGVIAANEHAGKRGFRLYPPWSTPSGRQARSTQNWQEKHYFHV